MNGYLQKFMPQHALSRFAGWMANSTLPWLKNRLISYFVHRYPVNMTEALESNPYAYSSFNDFFTRALKPQARPIASGHENFVSPADGYVSQFGSISAGKVIQAKNHFCTVKQLLSSLSQDADIFQEGAFLTVYLAPHNYHRVHMPCDGELIEMIHVPGHLFSVNMKTAASVSELFAQNERMIAIFKTPFGKMALVLIGAMIVGSIETAWTGTLPPAEKDNPKKWIYDNTIRFKKGEEMGRFKLGSTVIVLLEKNKITWEGLDLLMPVQMGQTLGTLR